MATRSEYGGLLTGKLGQGSHSLFQNWNLADLIKDLRCPIPAASNLRGTLPGDNAGIVTPGQRLRCTYGCFFRRHLLGPKLSREISIIFAHKAGHKKNDVVR